MCGGFSGFLKHRSVVIHLSHLLLFSAAQLAERVMFPLFRQKTYLAVWKCFWSQKTQVAKLLKLKESHPS